MLSQMPSGITIVELLDPSGPQPRFSARRSSEEVALMRASREQRKRGDLAKAERRLQISQMNSWLSARGVAPTVEISNARRVALRDCFNTLNADGGGTINLSELSLAMKALGFSAAACKDTMERGDRNGDGSLDFENFVALLTRVGGGSSGGGMDQDSFPFALIANMYRISQRPAGGRRCLPQRLTSSIGKPGGGGAPRVSSVRLAPLALASRRP